jgi:hypothetical protein
MDPMIEEADGAIADQGEGDPKERANYGNSDIDSDVGMNIVDDSRNFI